LKGDAISVPSEDVLVCAGDRSSFQTDKSFLVLRQLFYLAMRTNVICF